jgi:monofunctional biosynthetic peptidoglycan transglycosylase
MPGRRKTSFRRRRPKLAAALRLGLIALGLPVAFVLSLIVAFRFLDPPGSMLMAGRAFAGDAIQHVWVPLDRISPRLVKAVVTSEDARFCEHWGVDWGAVHEAIEDAQTRADFEPRGASTIAMQTAKNLFLWQDRSYLRKAIEVPLAYTMTLLWPKPRLIEIYLNIVEWGPGVFGAEAAARHHFGRSAAGLTRRQAAQLAAALPNPHARNAGRPGPRTLRLARYLERRAARESVPLGCIYPGQ